MHTNCKGPKLDTSPSVTAANCQYDNIRQH